MIGSEVGQLTAKYLKNVSLSSIKLELVLLYKIENTLERAAPIYMVEYNIVHTYPNPKDEQKWFNKFLTKLKAISYFASNLSDFS